MIKLTDLVYTFTLMAPSMKVNGRTIFKMVMVLKSGPIAPNMKVIIAEERSTVKVKVISLL